MKFVPHDYQQTALDFMMNHNRALIIQDMGLGKTVTSLTAIKKSMFPTDGSEPRYRRPLIIAPKIVSENTWANELAKWDHLKTLKYIELDATRVDQRLEQFDRIDDGVLTIMSESKIQWLIDTLNDVTQDREWPWDCVYIDEISIFKSPKSQRFKNLKKKLQNRCDYVYGLTGTPAPNDLADLWAIMLLIDRGARLGDTRKYFNKTYCKGITVKVNGGDQEITNYKVADEAYDRVLEDISDICIAMSAKDHLDDNPEIELHKHEVKLPKKTLDLIDELTVKRVLELAGRESSHKVERIERRIEKYQASGSLAKQRRIPKLRQKAQRIKDAEGSGDIVLRASHVFSLISIGRQIAGGAVYEGVPETDDEDLIAEFYKNRRVIEDNGTKLAKVQEIVDGSKDNVLIFYHYKHEADRIKSLYPDAKVLNTANARRVIPEWNRKRIRVLLANPASTKFGLNMQDGGHTIIWYGLDYSFEKYVQSNARLARQGQKNKVDVHLLLAADTIDRDIEAAIVSKSSINDFVYDSLSASKEARAEVQRAATDRIGKATQRVTGRRVIVQ